MNKRNKRMNGNTIFNTRKQEEQKEQEKERKRQEEGEEEEKKKKGKWPDIRKKSCN